MTLYSLLGLVVLFMLTAVLGIVCPGPWPLAVILPVLLLTLAYHLRRVSPLADHLKQVFWLKAVTRLDDRGTEIGVHEREERPDRPALTPEQSERIWIWLRRRRSPWRFVVPSLIILAMAVCTLGVSLFMVPLSEAVRWAIVLGLALFVAMCQRSLTVAAAPGSYALLAIGRCPSCDYDLAHLPPEADGCTVCPECGAAWRLLHCPQCGRHFETGLPDECTECGWRRPAVDERTRNRGPSE